LLKHLQGGINFIVEFRGYRGPPAIAAIITAKRDHPHTFLWLTDDFGARTRAPEISSDAFPAYPDAVEQAFGIECKFGTIEKHDVVDPAVEAARRYSPAAIVSISRKRIIGNQRTVSTSYIERQNLTLKLG
jgi:hypothetical protein